MFRSLDLSELFGVVSFSNSTVTIKSKGVTDAAPFKTAESRADNLSNPTDRFNSREEFEWAKGPFNDGAEARILGYGLDQCPCEATVGPFAVRSWRAGWTDADMTLGREYGKI